MTEKKSESISILDSLLGDATKILKDVDKMTAFSSEKTGFGLLIESQLRQMKVVSQTYEDEIKDLVRKMNDLGLVLSDLEDKIGSLKVEKENLEEQFGKYKKKSDKDVKKKSK